MFTSFFRATHFAFQHFWRNIWLSVITISMLVLTLLTINVLFLTHRVTDQAVQYVENRIDVSVYFYSSVNEERVQSVVEYLRALAQVRDVEIITPEEALERFKTRHASDETVLRSLDVLDGNPFGSTLVVKAHSADDFPFILDALENPQFRDDIRDKDFSDFESIVDRIRSTTDKVRTFGIVLTTIFLIVAILIIFNTVRIGVFIHREEIGIMKLVGASNAFVRAPFIIEAILYSVLALLIVVAIFYPSLAVVSNRFDQFFIGSPLGLLSYFESNALVIIGGELLGLFLITTVSTSLAMIKYLKV